MRRFVDLTCVLDDVVFKLNLAFYETVGELEVMKGLHRFGGKDLLLPPLLQQL